VAGSRLGPKITRILADSGGLRKCANPAWHAATAHQHAVDAALRSGRAPNKHTARLTFGQAGRQREFMIY